MVRDILVIYPQVSVFILPPVYRTQPVWFSTSYEALVPLFLSAVSHIDVTRVMVVPPLDVSAQDIEYDGVHLKPPALQRVLDRLLTTFRDGVFVRPADYPLPESDPEDDGELHCLFYYF